MAWSLYSSKDMATVMFVEITYTDNERKLQEIKTEIKFVSDANFTVSLRQSIDFNIRCPQDIAIKYVIDNSLFYAETTLQAVKKVGQEFFLTILAPQKIKQIRKRNFYRVCLKRPSIVIAIDNENNKDIFMASTIDLSAGGVLLHKLESALDNTVVKIDTNKYDQYVIILFLDNDTVLNLSARYIRTDWVNGSYNYAFEFINMNHANTDLISKYVTSAQVKKLGAQHN
jgi:c-di-GMP-binding flagellar brake protein YcgR